MAVNKAGKSQENYYARYKANKTWETNRKLRLERALKSQPNNEQIKTALKGMVYRRKTPKTQMWSATWIRTAKLFKEFTGRFDPACMSANADVSRAAMQRPGPRTLDKSVKLPTMPDKSFFSIATRIYKGAA